MPDQFVSGEPMPLAAKLWIAGLVLMLAAVLTSFACGAVLGGDTLSTVRIGSIDSVERIAGVEIPGSARLVNARLRRSVVDRDPIGWAIIDMPRDDAREFLSSPPFAHWGHESRPVDDGWGHFGGKRIEGWHPDEAEEWMGAWIGESRREAWHVNALADLDREPARVYLLLER